MKNESPAVSSPPTNFMTLEEANAMWKELKERAPQGFFSENKISFTHAVVDSGCESSQQLVNTTSRTANSLPSDAEDNVEPSTGGQCAISGEGEGGDQDFEADLDWESEEEEEKDIKRQNIDSDDDFEPDLGDLSDSTTSSDGPDDNEAEEMEKQEKGRRSKQQCNICKKYIAERGFTNHMKFVHGEKDLLCPHCGERFKYRVTLNAHIHKHTGELLYCDQCSKSYSSKHALSNHVLTAHKEANHVCALCPKKFTFGFGLAKHVKLVHDKVRDYLCPECGKAFGTKDQLRRHRLTHSGERKFECDLCGATFNQNSNLRIHKRSHKNNPDFMKKREWYSCPRCHVRCGNKKGLATHLKSHDI